MSYSVTVGTLSVDQWRPLVPPYDFLALTGEGKANRTSSDYVTYENEHGVGL